MKILLIGSELPGALEKFYLKHLRNHPSVTHVKLLDIHGEFYRYYKKNDLNKIYFRLGISKIYKILNENIINEINIYKPSHVWVFKGMEIFPETILKIKSLSIKTINFNPDNPFLFSGRGSGNSNVTNSLNYFDLHLTYNLSVLNQFKKLKIHAEWLPFGFENEEKIYEQCLSEAEINATCFVGNPDPQRSMFLLDLARSGFKIDVYGHNWKIKHKNIKLFSSVFDISFWITLRKYRIQLNPLRPHNINSHGMRSFEVPGVGGLLVTPLTDEHELFFKNKEEAFLYSNTIECCSFIDYLLSMNTKITNELRHQARIKCISSGYDYKSRTDQAFTLIKNLK